MTTVSSKTYKNLPRNQKLREKIARAIYAADGWDVWPTDVTDYDVWYEQENGKTVVCNGTEKWYRMADAALDAIDNE